MEQPNHHRGGEPTNHEHNPQAPSDQLADPPHEQDLSADDLEQLCEPTVTQLRHEALDLTYQSITEALRDGRTIDQETARVIAAVLYDSPESALGILAATGIVTDGLVDELDDLRPTAPSEIEPWLAALEEHVSATPSHRQEEDANEPTDSLPNPADHDSDPSAEQREAINDRTARNLARQFQQAADGPLATLAACGAILNEDDQLYRELFADWELHTSEQQTQAEALRSYVAGREDQGPVSHWAEARYQSASGEQPEIWVGSLTDYNNGVLHGLWIDADQPVDELQEQIDRLLRTSPTARRYEEVAEEYGIFDHSGFCGYEVSQWSSLDTVALIAHGIAEHGGAYAAWVEYVGETAGALTDDDAFRDHYEGEWDSLEAYVEYVLDETGLTQALDEAIRGLAEDLRHYVKVDVEGIAEEWAQGLYVVDAPDGRVWVFDAR